MASLKQRLSTIRPYRRASACGPLPPNVVGRTRPQGALRIFRNLTFPATHRRADQMRSPRRWAITCPSPTLSTTSTKAESTSKAPLSSSTEHRPGATTLATALNERVATQTRGSLVNEPCGPARERPAPQARR